MAIDANAPYARQMREIEKQMLAFAVESAGDDWSVAAQRLGVPLTFLRKRADAVGLEAPPKLPGTAKRGRPPKSSDDGADDDFDGEDSATLTDILRNPPSLSPEGQPEFADIMDVLP